jgi:hypothetical protein
MLGLALEKASMILKSRINSIYEHEYLALIRSPIFKVIKFIFFILLTAN